MRATHHAAPARALLITIALAESEATLLRFERENRPGLDLAPNANLTRARRASRARHALPTKAAEIPASPSASATPSPPSWSRALQQRSDL